MHIQELTRALSSKEKQRVWMDYIPTMHIDAERNYIALVRRCHLALLRDLRPLVKEESACVFLEQIIGFLESSNDQFIHRWLQHDMVLQMTYMVVNEKAKG